MAALEKLLHHRSVPLVEVPCTIQSENFVPGTVIGSCLRNSGGGALTCVALDGAILSRVPAHLQCDGLSVCRSSTDTMATSITDTPVITPRAIVPLTSVKDVESSGPSTPRTGANWVPDIEHVHVNDDPRKWSPKLKVSSFRFMI